MSHFFRGILLSSLLISQFNLSAQTPLLPRDPSIPGPQTFAMIMGVSKYKYIKPLAFADKDAILFKDYLKSPGGGNVKDQNIFMLLNDQASNANFWGKGFQWLKAKKLQRGDRLFIYLAGHGDAIDEDQFFFLGFDCNPKGDKNNYLVAGAIQLFNLKKKIAAETTKGVEVFFIMDACRSNELPGGLNGQNFLNTAISEKKAGEIIMLATGAGQESLEDASIGSGQGLFTYYLVDGLNGLADSIGTPDKRITFREIQTYVNKNVPSIAQQRFKRKQDPYFCCNENSDRIISTVDTAYLQRWQKLKKPARRGPGNSFYGDLKLLYTPLADTNLVETYNRFNRAINNDQVRAAEDYFNQLNKKFPGDPYTLDAKSSLAVEYIDIAQKLVDKYVDCGFSGSEKEKQENAQAASNLEKAIASVREDDADFANSLLGRLYLLRSSGNEPIAAAFNDAHAALRFDRNGAYAMNKLAQLHLANNSSDSAVYYADRAVKTAPNWPCALTTLALARAATNNANSNQPDQSKQPKKIPRTSFGIAVGGGIDRSEPTFELNPNANVIAIDPRTTAVVDLGVIVNIPLGSAVSVRPAATVMLGNAELVYQRRFSTGGPVFRDTVEVKNTSVKISLPFVIRFTNKKVNPYIALGPSFSYMLGESSDLLLTKKSLILGDAGFGVEFTVPKTGMVISPELRYSRGLTDMKDDAGTSIYSNTLSSLKKQTFTLSIYLRRR